MSRKRATHRLYSCLTQKRGRHDHADRASLSRTAAALWGAQGFSIRLVLITMLSLTYSTRVIRISGAPHNAGLRDLLD
jgi:hypothetical protein